MPQIPATITGNLTGDVHLKQLGNGARVARFRVAANRSYRDEEGNWKSTDSLFITVDCWNQLAENVKISLAKGMPVIVVGTLLTQEWPDKVGEVQQQILLKATSVGLDLNRYIVSSRRNRVEDGVTVDGVAAPEPMRAPVDEIIPPREEHPGDDPEQSEIPAEDAGAGLVHA